MDTLNERIGVARRRLAIEKFLTFLFPACCGWLTVAAIAIAVSKLWPVGVDPKVWMAAWIGGAIGAGILTAVVAVCLRHGTSLEAAIEIDKRFGLKERVSSAVGLDEATRETAVGQALLADTIKRIEQLDVAERFRVPMARSAWWPIVPAAIAIAVGLLFSGRVHESTAVAAATGEAPQQIKKSAQSLEKRALEKRKEAEKKGLKNSDADTLLKKLEEGAKQLSENPTDKQKAMVKLNDLSKEIEARRQKLGADEKLKQQLNNLKDLKKGPAEAAAQAMKNGKFEQAAKELDNLKKKLADGKMTEEEKKQLGEQMEQMKQTLQNAVEAHEQAKKDLEQQIEKQRQAGNTAQAEKMQQQLDKMNQQSQAMKKMEQLAGECKQCADAMKQGDAKQAQEALDKLSKQLEAMQQSKEEMAMLDAAMDEIADAKMNMAGEGKGKDGEDEGDDLDMDGEGKGKNQNGKPGRGMGEGQGKGRRPEQREKTGFYDSTVKQNVGKGAAVVVGQVEGQNRKGEVHEQVKEAFESAKKEHADPLTGERLPRDYRDHAKEYFEALRKGQP